MYVMRATVVLAKTQTQPHFVQLGLCILLNSMLRSRPNLTLFGGRQVEGHLPDQLGITMMNNIFQDLIAKDVVCIYLDNILIYTKMLEEHHWITHLVLEHLHKHQLYLKLEKLEMDPVKVVGVAEWLELKNKKEVQAFLGFANFYWRFIQDFLHHAYPLFNLTGKDVTWSWGSLEQTAFSTLKHTVTSGPVLLFPNNNSPF
ncbi:hypothetical protein E4T56_gene12326 [Termitomyces sp. T112]|nr:hypothetical protein E4T56_gene12326 [Termitomyces sp. T112]